MNDKHISCLVEYPPNVGRLRFNVLKNQKNQKMYVNQTIRTEATQHRLFSKRITDYHAQNYTNSFGHLPHKHSL